MRIEKVAIQNVNSLYGSFELDFTDSAYSLGLFAIVGPSGAGKSTILDAMCLALYGRTPRITVSSEHDEAMNRNSDKCRAEAVFVSGGRRYAGVFEHRRTIRSAKPFMPPKNELYECLEDGTRKALSDNKTEALRKIEDIIGLDYDQFTRSVMLAQFKFAEFLSANSGQRAEILEQVSGTDIYRRISVAVYNKQKEYKTQLEEIRIKKETVSLLSQEQVKAVSKELVTIESSISWLDALKTKTDECASVLKGIAQSEKALEGLFEKQRQIGKTLEEKKKALDEALAEEKKQKQQSARLTKILTTARELDLKKESAQKEEDRLKREMTSADNDILQQKKGILGKLKKHLPDADDAQLKKLYETDNEAQIITEHLSAELKQAEQKETKLKEKRSKLLLGRTEKIWTDRQDKLEEALPLVKARDQSKQAAAEQKALKVLLEKLEAESKKLDESIKENQEKFLYAKLQEKYGEQRKQLKDGEPCPLCGALEHPGAHEHIDTSFIKEAEEERQNLVEQKKKNESSITDIAYKVSVQAKELSDSETIIAGKEKLLEEFGGISAEMLEKEKAEIKKTLTQARNMGEEISAAGADVLRLTRQLGEVSEDVQQIKHAKQTIGEYEKRKGVFAKELEAAVKQTKEIASKRHELFGEKDADNEQRKQEEALEAAETKTKLIRQQTEAATAQDVANCADIASTKNRISEFKKSFDTAFSEVSSMAGQTEHLDSAGQTDTSEEIKTRLGSIVQNEEQPEGAFLQLSGSLSSMIRKLGERTGEARKTLSINEKNKEQVKELLSAEKKTGEEFKKWSELNSLIGSADGIKFSRIAQGITFDVLLRFANESLKKMSDRYILVRDSSSMASPLEINVTDNYQAGEQRPVSNLSGGESFVVSLALALGLSEMSSGRTQIDSLFIDEGFASLDENYLELALQTLSTLGNRQNKLIGVISHVKELKERIDTQIELTPLSGGRSSMEGPGVSVT